MTSATLAGIAPDADLLLWCNACHHHVTIPIADAIARYGAGRTVPSIKARCGKCAGHAAYIGAARKGPRASRVPDLPFALRQDRGPMRSCRLERYRASRGAKSPALAGIERNRDVTA